MSTVFGEIRADRAEHDKGVRREASPELPHLENELATFTQRSGRRMTAAAAAAAAREQRHAIAEELVAGRRTEVANLADEAEMGLRMLRGRVANLALRRRQRRADLAQIQRMLASYKAEWTAGMGSAGILVMRMWYPAFFSIFQAWANHVRFGKTLRQKLAQFWGAMPNDGSSPSLQVLRELLRPGGTLYVLGREIFPQWRAQAKLHKNRRQCFDVIKAGWNKARLSIVLEAWTAYYNAGHDDREHVPNEVSTANTSTMGNVPTRLLQDSPVVTDLNAEDEVKAEAAQAAVAHAAARTRRGSVIEPLKAVVNAAVRFKHAAFRGGVRASAANVNAAAVTAAKAAADAADAAAASEAAGGTDAGLVAAAEAAANAASAAAAAAMAAAELAASTELEGGHEEQYLHADSILK